MLAIATSYIAHFVQLVRYNHFCAANLMPRINGINFYHNRSKLSYFCQKKKVFFECWWIRSPHPMPPVAGGLAPRPQLPPVVGGSAPRPCNTSPIADFWLRACMKKNLLHVTAGLHLYKLLVLNIPGTFGEEDVLIHKRRPIIRPKVFHPVILIQKNYLKKSFHLHQSHFGLGRDKVFSF